MEPVNQNWKNKLLNYWKYFVSCLYKRLSSIRTRVRWNLFVYKESEKLRKLLQELHPCQKLLFPFADTHSNHALSNASPEPLKSWATKKSSSCARVCAAAAAVMQVEAHSCTCEEMWRQTADLLLTVVHWEPCLGWENSPTSSTS